MTLMAVVNGGREKLDLARWDALDRERQGTAKWQSSNSPMNSIFLKIVFFNPLFYINCRISDIFFTFIMNISTFDSRTAEQMKKVHTIQQREEEVRQKEEELIRVKQEMELLQPLPEVIITLHPR